MAAQVTTCYPVTRTAFPKWVIQLWCRSFVHLRPCQQYTGGVCKRSFVFTLGLPSYTLNPSPRRSVRKLAGFAFQCRRKTFWKRAFRKWWHRNITIIMCPKLPATQCCVFKFLRPRLRGKHLMPRHTCQEWLEPPFSDSFSVEWTEPENNGKARQGPHGLYGYSKAADRLFCLSNGQMIDNGLVF